MKIDTKQNDVLKALKFFGFEVVKTAQHIKLRNEAGVTVSVPNHRRVKGSTLSAICKDGGIDKKAFFAKL